MRLDVIDLDQFYASSLGQVAQRLIRRRLRAFWPSVAGQRIVGLGYATPYLRIYREEAERTLAVMPASQGVMAWPRDEPGLVALADEAEIPLPDASMDRILMVHALELSEQVRPLLREVWRVLAPGGRLIVVVPNRRGIWARVERTPFGYGYPFSPRQLESLLRDMMFSPSETVPALFVPPTRRRSILRVAAPIETLGSRWAPAFAGVLLVEAGKQVFATIAEPKRRRLRRFAAALPRPGRAEPARTEPARSDAARAAETATPSQPCRAP